MLTVRIRTATQNEVSPKSVQSDPSDNDLLFYFNNGSVVRLTYVDNFYIVVSNISYLLVMQI